MGKMLILGKLAVDYGQWHYCHSESAEGGKNLRILFKSKVDPSLRSG